MKTTKITENFLLKRAIGNLLAKCQFTTKYWDYENQVLIRDNCDSDNLDVLESGLCIFHERRYLEGYFFRDQRKFQNLQLR